MNAIGISSSGRKSAYSKIIVKDILEESRIEYEMIHLATEHQRMSGMFKLCG